MKLITYSHAGRTRLGALSDDVVVDLNRATAARCHAQGASNGDELADAIVPPDMGRFLQIGRRALDEARASLAFAHGLSAERAELEGVAVPAASVKLLPPVPKPPKIVCVARNYAEHAKEAGLQISEIPIVFARFAATLVAPGDPIVRPTVSDQLDWEGELAIIIGKGGRHITRDRAMEHVAGYSIFNDVTVRDYQFRVTQYTSGKNFAASGPFGPFLATAEEIPDPADLEITTEVNGVEKQRGHTSDMIYDLPTIVEHISEWIDLEPGDVIPTGTPAGVGFKRTPPEFLAPGDIVDVRVTGLGVLSNPVIAEEEA